MELFSLVPLASIWEGFGSWEVDSIETSHEEKTTTDQCLEFTSFTRKGCLIKAPAWTWLCVTSSPPVPSARSPALPQGCSYSRLSPEQSQAAPWWAIRRGCAGPSVTDSPSTQAWKPQDPLHSVTDNTLFACVRAWSCPTLCNVLDCSPPGPSVHGIHQAWILQWVAISFSRGSSLPRDRTCTSCISGNGRQLLYHWATREAHICLLWGCKTPHTVGGRCKMVQITT